MLVAWNMAMLPGHAQVLERHLDRCRFMVGNDVTLADYAIIHLEMLKDMTPFDWSPYPAVNAYFERMRAMPHWASTAVPPEAFGRTPEGVKAFAA